MKDDTDASLARWPRALALGLGVVLLLAWALAPVWVLYSLRVLRWLGLAESSDLTQAGQFGDMFNVLSSLLSAAAFLAVVVTLQMQIGAGRLQERIVHSKVFIEIVRIVQNEDVRRSRRRVFQALELEPKDRARNFKDDPELRRDAELVASTWETAARVAEIGGLAKDVLAIHWCDSIILSWKATKLVVSERREASPDLFATFERLAKRAEEIKNAGQAYRSLSAKRA